jgi:hypothetical protein
MKIEGSHLGANVRRWQQGTDNLSYGRSFAIHPVLVVVLVLVLKRSILVSPILKTVLLIERKPIHSMKYQLMYVYPY